jgi:hypothetical protein
VGIIDGIVLVRAGGDFAEGTGIDQFAAAEAGAEDLAVSAATVDTARAKPAGWDDKLGTVKRPSY